MQGRKVIPIHAQRAAQAKIDSVAPRALPLLNDLFPRLQRELSGQENVTVEQIIEQAYAILQPIVESVGTVATCHAGCGACCHIPVRISEYEAAVIAARTGRKMTKVSAKAAKRLNQKEFYCACPFLQEGRCSIYEFRPLMCRIHFSLDDSPDWCDYGHGVKHSVAYWDRRPIELIWSNVELSISYSIHGKPIPPWRQDIRQWFIPA